MTAQRGRTGREIDGSQPKCEFSRGFAVEPLTKGYIIVNTARFIQEDQEIRARIDPALLEEVNGKLLKYTATGWYPRSDLVKLYRAIAGSQPDEKAAYGALLRTGEYAGRVAIGTFMKLLFKILTPKMFASKFPDFYKRDHQGGEAAVEEVSEKRVALVARDIEGFDHFGPNTVGFATVALGAMGLKGLSVTCSPWSLAQPGPIETHIVATWE